MKLLKNNSKLLTTEVPVSGLKEKEIKND